MIAGESRSRVCTSGPGGLSYSDSRFWSEKSEAVPSVAPTVLAAAFFMIVGFACMLETGKAFRNYGDVLSLGAEEAGKNKNATDFTDS